MIEIPGGDRQRGFAARRVWIQLAKLQLDALTDRARANTRGIHGLHMREHALDFGGGDDQLGL